MINVRTIRKLVNNDGLTLKRGKIINYKTGYQVATEGKEATTPEETMKIIKEYKGNCGVWFSNGIYYIDRSHREATLKTALEVGRQCNQQSILRWRDKGLVWC